MIELTIREMNSFWKILKTYVPHVGKDNARELTPSKSPDGYTVTRRYVEWLSDDLHNTEDDNVLSFMETRIGEYEGDKFVYKTTHVGSFRIKNGPEQEFTSLSEAELKILEAFGVAKVEKVNQGPVLNKLSMATLQLRMRNVATISILNQKIKEFDIKEFVGDAKANAAIITPLLYRKLMDIPEYKNSTLKIVEEIINPIKDKYESINSSIETEDALISSYSSETEQLKSVNAWEF